MNRRLLASALGLVLVLGACSDGADDQATASFNEVGAPIGDSDDGGDMSTPDVVRSGGGSGSVAMPEPIDAELTSIGQSAVDRKIIYTGFVDVVVADIEAALDDLLSLVASEGGFVFGQQLRLDDDERNATITLKVPVVRYDAVVSGLREIGAVTRSDVSAEDVTAQFVDLESRSETLRTSIERLRGFLDQAVNVDEVTRLEAELTNRESERDALEAQLRVLRDRTTYGTVTVSLEERSDGEIAELDDDDDAGFGAGLDAGVDLAGSILQGAATVAGFALPFLPVVALAAVLLWLARRGGRGRDVEPAA